MKTIAIKHSHIFTNENGRVFLTVEKSENNGHIEWSFVGVEGPKSNGNAKGSCGQCIDIFPENIQKLWKKYHLNGMTGGTEKQNAFIKEKESTGWKYNYTEACEALKEAGLYEENGYKYGHSWLFPANPNDKEINEFFESLKDDSSSYPWRN